MATLDLTTIHIAASFVAANGKAEKALALALQYFDAAANHWKNLNTLLSTDKGKLDKTIKLNTKSIAVAALKALAAAGALPSFRLVLKASLNKPVALVVSQAPHIGLDAEEKSLTLNFGNNYAQSADIVKTYLYNKEAAVSSLYAVLPSSSQVNTGIDQLQKENQELAAAVAAAEEKVKVATDAAKAAEAALKKETVANTKVMATMEAEIEKVRKISRETETSLAETKSLVIEKETLLAAAAQSADLQSQELSLLRQQLDAVNLTITRNVETIQQLNDQLKTNSLELATRDKVIAQQVEINKQLEDKIRQLSQVSGEYKPVAQPVSAVYASILDEFKKTNELNKNGAYRVSNISLNLKTFVEHDATGIRMQLIDANKLSALPASALSDFRVDIGEATISGGNTIRLPELLGLTESAARKILVSLGLNLKPVYQQKKEIPDGQAFRQSPGAGNVQAGETVTIVFSKK